MRLLRKLKPVRLNGARCRFIRFFAGLTAVLVSPFIASGISEKAAGLSTFVSSAVGYIENNEAPPLLMNSETLLLYKPAADSMIIKEPLSLLNHTETQIESTEAHAAESNVKPDLEKEHTSTQVMSRNITDAYEDLSTYTARDGEIVKTTFAPNGGTNFINLKSGGQIRNETELENEEILAEIEKRPDFAIKANGEPEVLIIHTHASEAYQPTERGYYDSEYISRSIDAEKNVIAVGAEIAEAIAGAGIAVIHDGTMHDIPEYNGSYNRSAETVRAILEEFPSIKVVLDIHRDAISGEDGTLIAAVAEIDGEEASQIMIISAADDGTYNIPEYKKNLRFAALLQSQIESDSPGITRPVLFQYCQYNQHLSTGSLLIEVGSNGNTIEQAKLAGRLIGQSIGKALLSLKNDL